MKGKVGHEKCIDLTGASLSAKLSLWSCPQLSGSIFRSVKGKVGHEKCIDLTGASLSAKLSLWSCPHHWNRRLFYNENVCAYNGNVCANKHNVGSVYAVCLVMGNNWVWCLLSIGACGCVYQFLKGRSKQAGVLTVTAACGSVFQHVHNMQSSTQQQNMPFSSTSTSHTSSTSTFGSRMMWLVRLDSRSASWESGLAWTWVKFHHQWWVSFVMCHLLMTSVQAVCSLEGRKLFERAARVQALCWPGSPRKPAQCRWHLQTREQMGRFVFRHPLTSLWGDYGALCRSVIGCWTTYRTWPWPPKQHTILGPGLLNNIQDVALASWTAYRSWPWPPKQHTGRGPGLLLAPMACFRLPAEITREVPTCRSRLQWYVHEVFNSE